ncbi:hypothetical protein GCM10010306_096640 [Streptomyces umbrinus]|nr:hypothetical protein GCM10010306_096640 [Streptomyces umbrinus]
MGIYRNSIGYARVGAGSDDCGGRESRDGTSKVEVLTPEAVEAPEIGPGCRLMAGRWWSN